jgi:hypothetical protein
MPDVEKRGAGSIWEWCTEVPNFSRFFVLAFGAVVAIVGDRFDEEMLPCMSG